MFSVPQTLDPELLIGLDDCTKCGIPNFCKIRSGSVKGVRTLAVNVESLLENLLHSVTMVHYIRLLNYSFHV